MPSSQTQAPRAFSSRVESPDDSENAENKEKLERDPLQSTRITLQHKGTTGCGKIRQPARQAAISPSACPGRAVAGQAWIPSLSAQGSSSGSTGAICAR